MPEFSHIQILAKIAELHGRKIAVQAQYDGAWRSKAFWDNAVEWGKHRRDVHNLVWNDDEIVRQQTMGNNARAAIEEELGVIDRQLAYWFAQLAELVGPIIDDVDLRVPAIGDGG